MRAPSLAETECDAEAAEIEVDGQEPLTVPENLSLSQIAQAIFEEQTAANLTIAENEWEPIALRHELEPHGMQMTTTPEPEATAPEPEPSEPAPPDPQAAPGYFRLSDTIALRAGLALGKLVNATEFGKILLNIHCPIRRGRKQHSEQRKAVAA